MPRIVIKRLVVIVLVLYLVVADRLGSVVHAQAVVPIDWSRFTAPSLSPFQEDVRYSMNKLAGYNLNRVEQTIPTVASLQTPSGRRYDMQSGGEGEIRQLSHIVYGAAGILKTGAYDSALTGFDQATFRNRTIEMIHGATLEHTANNSGVRWGNSWQSALWAAHLAEGAWMMWDDLPAATRTYVTNMTTYEANRFLNYNVPYWADRDGSLNYPGDTKAEENAWNSRLLSVAVAMMPDHANSQTWRSKGSELMVSSFARPSDLQNVSVVDGKNVKDWLDGYNAFESGFVENHGLIHNDYMSTTGLIIQPFITQSLADQTVPQAAGFNGAIVYDAMASVPIGPQQRTMFQRGPNGQYIPDQHYPEGTDWSPYRYDIFLEMDVYANVFNFDANAPYDAMGWAGARLDRIQQMQSRHADGRLYANGEFDSWSMREASALQLLTNIYMINWLDAQDAISPQGNWVASLTPRSASHLGLVVDRTTGEITVVNTSNVTDVHLDGYAIHSLAGQLDATAWTSLKQRGLGDWIAANPSANLVSELRASGATTIRPGEQLSLGRIFAPPAPSEFGENLTGDIRFDFTASGGQILEGAVQYTGAARNSTLSLVIDPLTGRTSLRNDTPFDPTIEGYVITSASGALQAGNDFWNSFADQDIDGGAWIEANASASQIAELIGTGAAILPASSTFDLGQPFNPSGARDIVFHFLLAGESTPTLGIVVYEPVGRTGDFNYDGAVDAADYVVWRKINGSSDDYAKWRTNFGQQEESMSNSLADSYANIEVPEPASTILILLTLPGALLPRRSKVLKAAVSSMREIAP